MGFGLGFGFGFGLGLGLGLGLRLGLGLGFIHLRPHQGHVVAARDQSAAMAVRCRVADPVLEREPQRRGGTGGRDTLRSDLAARGIVGYRHDLARDVWHLVRVRARARVRVRVRVGSFWLGLGLG